MVAKLKILYRFYSIWIILAMLIIAVSYGSLYLASRENKSLDMPSTNPYDKIPTVIDSSTGWGPPNEYSHADLIERLDWVAHPSRPWAEDTILDIGPKEQMVDLLKAEVNKSISVKSVTSAYLLFQFDCNEEQMFDLIYKGLYSEDQDLYLTSRTHLLQILESPDKSKYLDRVWNLARSDDIPIKIAGLFALAYFSDQEDALSTIIKYCESDVKEIRMAVVYALRIMASEYNSQSDRPEVLYCSETLLNDADTEISQEMVKVLSRYLYSEELKDILYKAYYDSKDETIRFEAVNTISNSCPSNVTLPILRDALHDSDPDLRRTALYNLREHGSKEEFMQAAEKALKDSNRHVRNSARENLNEYIELNH